MATKQEQSTVDYLKEVYQHYSNHRRQIETNLIMWLKAYRGWDDVYEQYKRLYGDLGLRSTIYFPIIYANIETLTPKVVMAVAGDPDFVELVPTEEQDIDKIDPMKTIIFKQWSDMKAFDQIIGHVTNRPIIGFA